MWSNHTATLRQYHVVQLISTKITAQISFRRHSSHTVHICVRFFIPVPSDAALLNCYNANPTAALQTLITCHSTSRDAVVGLKQNTYCIFYFLFGNMANKCTIISQIITLLHIVLFSTLTEAFPCFSLSRNANVRAYLAKTGHGPHSSLIVLFHVLIMLFHVLCCLNCVVPCIHCAVLCTVLCRLCCSCIVCV